MEEGRKAKGNEVVTVEGDGYNNTLIVYESPPSPKMSDFLEESWAVRRDKMDEDNPKQGF